MAVRPQATSDRQRALPVRVPLPLKLTRMGGGRTKAMLFMGQNPQGLTGLFDGGRIFGPHLSRSDDPIVAWPGGHQAKTG